MSPEQFQGTRYATILHVDKTTMSGGPGYHTVYKFLNDPQTPARDVTLRQEQVFPEPTGRYAGARPVLPLDSLEDRADVSAACGHASAVNTGRARPATGWPVGTYAMVIRAAAETGAPSMIARVSETSRLQASQGTPRA